MALIVTIKAAYDIENIADLQDIGEDIRAALETLRQYGAARVDAASFDKKLDMDSFMKESNGLSDFEFTIPKPVAACITFD